MERGVSDIGAPENVTPGTDLGQCLTVIVHIVQTFAVLEGIIVNIRQR